MRRTVILGVAAIALAMSAASAEAQKPISIGIAGGVAMPQGDFKDLAGTGFNGTVSLGLGLPMLPVGVRIDGSYNRFSFSDEIETLFGESGSWSIASATANVTLGLPMSAIVVSPYLIAGGGNYWGSCSLDGCDTESDFGWNAGLGVKFRLAVMSANLEARYHSVASGDEKTTYLPVTFGIMF